MIESSVVTVLIPEAPIDFFCTSVFLILLLQSCMVMMTAVYSPSFVSENPLHISGPICSSSLSMAV